MRDVQIKDMTPAKFEAVEAIDLQTEHEQGTTLIVEELEEMFGTEGIAFATYHGRVAEVDGEVVGYIIWVHADVAGVGIQSIFNLVVLPEYRREGIASALVSEIDENKAAIIVEADEDKYEVLNFWSKNKFVVTRVDPALYDEETMIHPAQFVLRKEPRKPIQLHQRLKWRAS